MIKQNSKTLTRFNQDGVFVLKYHDTNVLERNGDKIILRTGGWLTKSTARAINFGLVEIGLSSIRVLHKSSRKTGEVSMIVLVNDLALPLNRELTLNLED